MKLIVLACGDLARAGVGFLCFASCGCGKWRSSGNGSGMRSGILRSGWLASVASICYHAMFCWVPVGERARRVCVYTKQR